MRYLVGEHNNSTSVFLINGERAVNLTVLSPDIGSDLMSLINTPDTLPALTEEIANAPQIAVSKIVPALPIERPGKVICLGLNYVDHVKEGGYEIPTYPALFMRGLNSLMPAGAPMVRPAVSEKLDYEAELMVIIGTSGRHIDEDDAYKHVFGYTLFNDGSVRDYQRKTHQWTPGKNFDNTGAIGPIVVTPDELPSGCAGLKIESRIGDEVMQSASTSEMMWPVAKTIATLSEFATLEAGDMIAMGTPPGVGNARNPPRFLQPGDVISVEIEGIGICSNPVKDEN
ncbi:MAG: 5-oxopent-3-ene-1,2,5-tricarboxylate decarboxylase [Rhodobacteraceae bacterium]|nr:5-oxopent-3-ene-1,2,5-tricarboxylate decarboxylase [Paracoccaceae bacterium]